MPQSLGDLIKRGRERRGWDQEELARRVGSVSQQSVSRWERNLTKPRGATFTRLAAALDLDISDLQRASQPSLPVRPLADALPFGQLPPDRFEQFATDFVQCLHPESDVHRFGSQGHKQDGIDLFARHPDGTVETYQCKRRETFGPADVRSAVGAVTVSAKKHHVLLTRVASPGARKEIIQAKNWKLWDVDDISRAVRSLSRDKAVNIVDTYFPGWREQFLGVRDPGPWWSPDEYFLPLNSSNIFRQDWSLVGRMGVLDEIATFASQSTDAIGLVVGRGGIGKTRLLREVARTATDRGVDVRFLERSANVSPAQFEQLPDSDPLVIVIDDVHDRDDTASILANINRERPHARVLLALRPYAMSQLAAALRGLGLHTQDLRQWELQDLSQDEAEDLASEILGDRYDRSVIRRLARLTTDCPLITVLGASLIARGTLDPERLEASNDIRADILTAFHEALVAEPASGDSALRHDLLDAIAVLQPVRLGEQHFIAALEALVERSYDRISQEISSLEDAGVLLRRGQSIRIVPDLLGDVILARACFDDRSQLPTRYIERVLDAAADEPLRHVFVNASRVDWQVRRDEMSTGSLVDSVWSTFESRFRSSAIWGRVEILRTISRVAYFQPRRAMDLVVWAIKNPTDEIEDSHRLYARLYSPTYDDVLRGLPPILKAVAYNLDYLKDALDLLWQLAQLDERRTNQHPEHALRVLEDLSGYELGKPLVFNDVVVDAAVCWLNEPGDLWRFSPFDVLGPLLATEGAEESSSSFRISFRPYSIDVAAVRLLRERVLNLAIAEATSAIPARGVRAIAAIEEALRGPVGLYGRPVTEDERDTWKPSFLQTIRQLLPIASNEALDPVVGVALRLALSWHANYSETETRDAAVEVLNAIPDDPDHKLALVLHGSWGRLRSDRATDYHDAQRKDQQELRDLSNELISRLTDEEIVAVLEQRLGAQTSAFGTLGSPGEFVWTLVDIKQSIGDLICQHVIDDHGSPLAGVVSFVLSQLASSHESESVDLARALMVTGSPELAAQAAHAFGWGRGGRTQLLSGEQTLLLEMATHEDARIRISAARAAQVLSLNDRASALEILMDVRFSDSKEVADEVLECFTEHGSLRWADLTSSQRSKLLGELQRCPSLDDYNITIVLSDISKEDPDAIVDLLRRRIEHAEQSDASAFEYDALPFHWHSSLCARQHREFERILDGVLRWMSEDVTSWRRQREGARLFKLVAGDFDEHVLNRLEHALGSGSRERLDAAASVLSEAPRGLVLKNVEFVRRALVTAAGFGEDSAQRVGRALHGTAESCTRAGIPGEPFSDDIEQQEQARRIADALPRGSLEERFYRSLERSALQSIEFHAEQDGKLFDQREW